MNLSKKGFTERTAVAEHHHVKTGWQIIFHKISGLVSHSFFEPILYGNLLPGLADTCHIDNY